MTQQWSDMAQKIFKDRYSIKDDDSNPIETPTEILSRVSEWAANGDKLLAYNFYEIMKKKDFFPNTPTLINGGRGRDGTKSACFTFDVEDDIFDIFHVLGTKAAIITKQGGGVGFNLSKLRPRGDKVTSSGGIASGAVSFMSIAQNMVDLVSQGGVRRGAIMMLLHASHPDIYEFITCKNEDSEYAYNNMNLSVLAPKELFQLAEEERKVNIYKANWKLINPRNKQVMNIISARKLLEDIAQNSVKRGEPAIVEEDNLNSNNPTLKGLGWIYIVNPCAEYGGYNNESCTLGSINLSNMVKLKDGWLPVVDYDKLQRTIILATQFLDNVISLNDYAFPEIEKATKLTRKIGIGVMGFATMLYKMNIKYGSDASITLAKQIMGMIQDESHKTSAALAQREGNFPAWEKSIFSEKQQPMRNATTTTIAPTGTISKLCQVSGGIEPVYNFITEYEILGGQKILDYDPVFIEACNNYQIGMPLVKEAVKRQSIQDLPFPEEMKKVFVTAKDLDLESHLAIVEAFQKFTDNGISKTVNMPEGSTWQEVLELYFEASKRGLKGISIYVEKSREKQVLNTSEINEEIILQIFDKETNLTNSVKVNTNMTYPITELLDGNYSADLSHCVGGMCDL